MKPTLFLFILALVLTISASIFAAEIHCPASINETPNISNKYIQWTVVANSGERPLERAGVYLGIPPDYGAQVPDSTKSDKKKETVTWKISRANSDLFWIGCSYVGTTATLFQQIGNTIEVCTATYDLLPSGKRLRLYTLECR